MTSTGPTNDSTSLTNYVAYHDALTARNRVGHYDLARGIIQPLSFASGTPIDNLYQVIEAGESNIIGSGEPVSASSVKVLPPLTGRDVLCVGKNYAEHAKEFNSSGFDSSDKVDQPSHPVIFTKRFTSIIADGEEILPHPSFTKTADYEGEIGVIIGKSGIGISEADAMDHVWGYTIINDMTARERQRDHKQFYIGKSPDTFCPMGPIAVPATHLEKVLRVQTHVNGELRQNATTDELIFSIPFLIKTLSEAQTLVPGDVLATGTPAGVGIGRKPPIYLKPGDEIAVSVTGLGTLTNSIAEPDSPNPTIQRVKAMTHLRSPKTAEASPLTRINSKPTYYKSFGQPTGPSVVFVHCLGGSTEVFLPLIQALKLDQSHSLHLFDLEGHGRSPTSPLSRLSIESFAEDLNGVFQHANITSGATIIAHSLGCLVAVQFAINHPDQVSKLVLLGPPRSPLLPEEKQAAVDRAANVRTYGMASVIDGAPTRNLSEKTRSTNPIVVAALRMSLLGQDAEGYAKGCTALAKAKALDFGGISQETLIITGSEDQISTPDLCEGYSRSLNKSAGLVVLRDVGHWHVFEDVQGVSEAVWHFIR